MPFRSSGFELEIYKLKLVSRGEPFKWALKYHQPSPKNGNRKIGWFFLLSKEILFWYFRFWLSIRSGVLTVLLQFLNLFLCHKILQ